MAADLRRQVLSKIQLGGMKIAERKINLRDDIGIASNHLANAWAAGQTTCSRSNAVVTGWLSLTNLIDAWLKLERCRKAVTTLSVSFRLETSRYEVRSFLAIQFDVYV